VVLPAEATTMLKLFSVRCVPSRGDASSPPTP
jgi:hypothetical protein